MSVGQVVFWLAAVGAVLGAIGMLSSPNPVHSALFLVFSLFCVAVVYLLMGAEFLAIIQVIVYAGAIMVLFLFVIMLLNLKRDEFGQDRLFRQYPVSYLATAVLGAVLTTAGLAVGLRFSEEPTLLVPADRLANLLFTKYLLPFELASLILLIAMIGVVVMVKRPRGG
ncbi:MAG: NADH-quinone oxidoreductase subunit J [Armatimonadetes bacterium]|nr:NADH-quinone oxidoreductase subunit J [Armatimonadota bacterium]MDW8122641.1 NADH-quinone oxidoreductase subunit J [Armatimonadota bacterium]